MRDHDDHRRRQDRVLQAVVELCAADANILGVTVTGSYARGDNDAFSDLDLNVFFRDDERSGAGELHTRVSAVERTLSVLYLYDRNGLYLFETGVRLDLTYKPRSEVRMDSAQETRILHDRHAVLASELGAKQVVPPPPAHPRYFQPGDPEYVRWFLWMFRQVYAWTKRAAQADHRSLDKLLAVGDSLQVVRASLLEMRRWTLGTTDYLGVVYATTARGLVDSYSSLSASDLLTATRRLIDVYERVCPAYCEKAGVRYPASELIELGRVLDEFDALS